MGYKKISRAQARKRFLSFKPFIICASKVSPASMFAAEIGEHTSQDYVTNEGFDAMVNEFKYYNCGPDTGHGVKFYIKEA